MVRRGTFFGSLSTRYEKVYGIVQITEPKTRRMTGHATQQHVLLECPGIFQLVNAMKTSIPDHKLDTCPKSAGHPQLRTSIEEFGFLATSGLNTGYEPNEFDKITSVEDDTTLINDPDHNTSDFSKTTNENTCW